jgi:hypothetical protein
VRQGFNSKYMESVIYTSGAGQQKENSRGAKDLRDGKRADTTGGKFAGLHPEGQIPSGKPHRLLKTVVGAGVWWRSVCR